MDLKEKIREFAYNAADVWISVCWVTLIIFASATVTGFLSDAIGLVPALSVQVLSMFDFWMGVFISMMLVGVTEETLFRYILQEQILDRIFVKMPWISTTLASFVFGIAHFNNPGNWVFNLPQVVAAFCAGLYLGQKYRERGLLFVILVHGLYDFLVSILLLT